MADLQMVKQLLRNLQFEGDLDGDEVEQAIRRAERELDEAEKNIALLRQDRTEGAGLRRRDDRPTQWDSLRAPPSSPYEFT